MSVDRFSDIEDHYSCHATNQEYAQDKQYDKSTKIQLIDFLKWRRSQD